MDLRGEDITQSSSSSDSFSPEDVLLGRSRLSYNHPGNKRFRQLILANSCLYNETATRKEKAGLVCQLIGLINGSGGRFLRHASVGGWREVSIKVAREKVGHALRDAFVTQAKERPTTHLSSSNASLRLVGRAHNAPSPMGMWGQHPPHVSSQAGYQQVQRPSPTPVPTLQQTVQSQLEHLINLRSRIETASLRLQVEMRSQQSPHPSAPQNTSSSLPAPQNNGRPIPQNTYSCPQQNKPMQWQPNRGMAPVGINNSLRSCLAQNEQLPTPVISQVCPDPISLAQVSDDEPFEGDFEDDFLGSSDTEDCDFDDLNGGKHQLFIDHTLETLRHALDVCDNKFGEERPTTSLVVAVSDSLSELGDDESLMCEDLHFSTYEL